MQDKVNRIYHLIVDEIRTTRERGYVPDLDSIVAGLRAELDRDVRLGRFSKHEAMQLEAAIGIAREMVRRDWAYI